MSHKRPLPAALVTGLPARDSGTLAARPASPAAGDTYANCDQSTLPPVLNVNDFSCFTNAFAAGCANP